MASQTVTRSGFCPGQIDNIELAPQLLLREASEPSLKAYSDPGRTRAEALSFLIDMLSQRAGGAGVLAAEHRVVHGGARFREPVVVDCEVLAVLQTFVPLAPLHQPQGQSRVSMGDPDQRGTDDRAAHIAGDRRSRIVGSCRTRATGPGIWESWWAR